MKPVCNRPTYFVIVGIKVKEIKIAGKSTQPEKNISSPQNKVKPTKGESNGS